MFEKVEEGYQLTVNIPFVKKEELELLETPTDLMIKLGNFKRNIPLPLSLRKYHVTGAKCENEQLVVAFEANKGSGIDE